MDTLLFLFLVAVVLVSLLFVLTIWARKRLVLKVTALGCGILALAVIYPAFTLLLGRPKPVELEWLMRDTEDVEVIAFKLEEDEAIYLWLSIPGIQSPRYYSIPWDLKLAKQIQRAGRKSEQDGTSVRMRSPFEKSLETNDDPVFYPEPWPVLPPKIPPELPDQSDQSVIPDAERE